MPFNSSKRISQSWVRNGLVGAWCPALTGATGTDLFDLSGFNNTGVLTNMDAATDWVQSDKGLALDFDGSDDYVSIPTVGFPTIQGPKTVSIWTQWDGTAGRRLIFSLVGNDTGTANTSWGIEFDGSLAKINQWGAGTNASSALTGITSNTWVNLVGVLEPGGTNSIFVNAVVGSYQGTTSNSGTVGVCRIASFNSAFPTPCHNRPVAEVLLWNRALTALEIQNLYSFSPGYGLIGYGDIAR